MPASHSLHDPLRTVTVSIRILALGHILISIRVVEEVAGLIDDPLTRHSDDFRHAKLRGFRTLRKLAEHQNWLSKRGCLFLDPTRISQHQKTSTQQANEGEVV